MKNTLKLNLRSAFFEAVFVVFGVVLALAANEWRQEVKAQELAKSALESMKVELQTNLDLVIASRNYHQSQAEKLQGMIAQKQSPSMRDFPKGFIHPAWVTDTAWEVAKATGVLSDLEYQRILDLSSTYDRLDHYVKQGEAVGQQIYRIMLDEGPDSILAKPANLVTILYTFLYREMQLQEDLQALLARLP